MKPPKVDLDLGMLTYLHEGPGVEARLREKPSDFIVDEVLSGVRASVSLREGFGGRGKYLLLVGARIGMDTPYLTSLISKKYRDVRYSGLKDKRSVAFQYFTARGKERIIRRRGLLVKPVGRREVPLKRGENDGNWFYIRVRDVNSLRVPQEFPNFFSYQRFGVKRPYNHEIGRALVRREYKEAVEMIREQGHLRGEVRGDLQSIVQAIGRGLARLYVHAYQSYLFNLLLSRRIGEGLSPIEGDYVLKEGWIIAYPEEGDLLLPIPGGFTRTLGGWLERELNSILKEEGVKLKDFLFREVPEISGFGDFRKAVESPRELKIFDRGEPILSFFLPSGVYATSFLREVIKPKDPATQGFI